MARFVAFLRGMNLGGRRLSNEQLCAAVEALGFTEVEAFLASGNLVFDAGASAARVRTCFEQGLPERLGYPVPTFVRSAAQVRAIAAHTPFQGRPGHDKRGKLQVAFLAKRPSAKAREAALAVATRADWLAIHGSELYWSPTAGMATSDLDLRAAQAALGPFTIRTKNTIERLTKKYLQQP